MIRFAILAGVSTDAQATPEKNSIPDQIKYCRDRIAHEQGIETSGPFVMDGYSRTGYDSLDIACNEIPPLGEAIRSAGNDQYDILIMDNFDRLGDLGLIVKTRFKKIRKQLHSARQSGKITPPELYDPYNSEDADIDMYVEGIIQSYRINKMRRAWNVGVPGRARRGLHPLSLPFGYRVAGKDQPAVQIPEQAQLILHIKDWFLAGKTLQDICHRADVSGIQPPRAAYWSRMQIKRILQNRYYAGITTFGKLKTVDKKRIPLPPSQWITAPGRHIPLYDDSTYLAILNELDRRDGLRSRSQTYALSGLLTCSVCGKRLHRHGRVDSVYPVDLVCPAAPAHVIIAYHVAHKIIAHEVTKGLSQVKATETAENAAERFHASLRAQEQLRQQIQTGYENKLYTLQEASARIVAIETEIERLTLQRDRAQKQSAHTQALLQLARQDLTRIHHWILHDDPTAVNHLLTALCQTIILTPMYDINIVWR